MAEMLHLIYDGQCGFCIRALKVCQALDTRHRFAYHDGNARQEVYARFPQLAGADFEHAMFAVAPDGRAYRGFFAFRRLAWESPLLWPLLPFLYMPGTGWLGPRVYAWIARNRRRFGCESAVCQMPPRGEHSRLP